MSVLVYCEYRGGEFRHSVYEALSAGRKIADDLGSELIASVIGISLDGAAEKLGKYGPDKIIISQNDAYTEYNQEIHAAGLKAVAEKYSADVIMLSATTTGKELAPRLAAKMKAGYAADCSEMCVEDGKLTAVRPIYAGKALYKVGFIVDTKVISLRPKLFQAVEKPGSPAVEEFSFETPNPGAKIVSIEAKQAGSVDLTEADMIVSGGRGVKGKEGFAVVEQLADALGAVVGASRAAVDADWIDHSHQVGQTGKTVNPSLYVALGISGAIQHIAGMRNAKVIVAVNKDSEAPIFKIADYGIVGDLFAVVPALVDELKK